MAATVAAGAGGGTMPRASSGSQPDGEIAEVVSSGSVLHESDLAGFVEAPGVFSSVAEAIESRGDFRVRKPQLGAALSGVREIASRVFVGVAMPGIGDPFED